MSKDSTTELWRPIADWEGLYSVSSHGRVRSEKRTVKHGLFTVTVPEKILKTPPNASGYPVLRLHRDSQRFTVYVHDLVAAAFIGQKTPGQQVRHLNDRKLDCRVSNLAIGTRSENQLDAVRNGRNHNANKTHCIAGHPYTPQNTYVQPVTGSLNGWRKCRECTRNRTCGRQKVAA